MNSKRSAIFGIVTFITICMFSTQVFSQEWESREWWSQDGRESVLASFVKFDKKSDIVSLRDQSGEQIEVKITSLSRADRRYVAKAFKKATKSDLDSSVFKRPEAALPDVAETENAIVENDRRSPKTFRRYGINWTKGLDNALAKATQAGERRPVMWFRVLGDLNGLM